MALDHTNPGTVAQVLWPVRGDGSAVHYVRKGELASDALCETEAPLDARNRARWRRVTSAVRMCMTCHALSCAKVSRVEWK